MRIDKFETIEKLGTKPTNTPAKQDLFEVNEGTLRLEEKKRVIFSLSNSAVIVCIKEGQA